MVDWSKPIEAYKDGASKSVELVAGPYPGGIYEICHQPDDCDILFKEDGSPNKVFRWRIRNVQPAAANPAISDELVERMVALVRSMAVKGYGCDPHTTIYMTAGQFDEARAIVDELPQPVEPDLLEARQCAITVAKADGDRDADSWYENATPEDNRSIALALAAIKRGRALERGEQ